MSVTLVTRPIRCSDCILHPLLQRPGRKLDRRASLYILPVNDQRLLQHDIHIHDAIFRVGDICGQLKQVQVKTPEPDTLLLLGMGLTGLLTRRKLRSAWAFIKPAKKMNRSAPAANSMTGRVLQQLRSNCT
jgi:PEP-CTERM motif